MRVRTLLRANNSAVETRFNSQKTVANTFSWCEEKSDVTEKISFANIKLVHGEFFRAAQFPSLKEFYDGPTKII